ncbi:hypothetical protein Aph02nite_65500 [Actinoplanes philippinensis]|uniref:PknH-like extracellular domain-containing protein n=1 Tax=Actinoplanes philippinensis TaxID=35752 RepID=A0A1I2LB31_9ACTN|nr:hypothetical protein [Actinoplanes philippinensis]GIE80600.1 hypothetical protein Aph02nite_65500 [Actinoplanes philippinensis]SFF76602.1 hypothetical protein SAMN05421541_12124 [Actinoplanes philippinensis]
MRRIALTCAAPALAVAVAVTGTAAATDVVPAPAASPPLGDDFFAASDMRRGLLAPTDLPAGWSAGEVSSGQTDQIDRLDTDACSIDGGMSVQRGDNGSPITYAAQSFTHTDGSSLTIDLYALGAEPVADWIADTAAPPTACPVVTADGVVVEHHRLPLPGLGKPASGLIRVTRDRQEAPQRRHTAIIGWNAVVVAIEETNTSEAAQARFVGIVEKAARQVERIAGGPAIEDLRRGLLTLADLPEGFRVTADDTAESRTLLTERGCDGAVTNAGDERLAAVRSFARGGATVSVAVAVTADPYALISAMRSRITDCPAAPGQAVAEPPSISTDMSVGGIVYQDRPARLRGIANYRDIVSDVRVTMTDGIDLTAAEEIREAALRATWRVYD